MEAKRILMRAGMSPFETISAQHCMQKNLIASNSGNILFAYSVYRTLSAKGVDIDVNRYRIRELDVGEINEKYDAFVIPLANAFRRSYAAKLDALAEIINKIKVPCVVVGVGAQTDLGHSIMDGSPIDASVKRFVSAILEKSASIGVRGEFTYDYLKKLGFSDIDVIGCPSMYANGANIDVRKEGDINPESNVALNLTKGMPKPVCDLFRRTWKVYRRATYIAQDMNDFKYIYLGRRITGIKKGDAFPRKMDHPLYVKGGMRFFFSVPAWIQCMKEMKFSFGTRIHGNVFALLAGTPAVVVAHDSRTLELSRFFQIPHILSSEIKETTSAASLYEMADFSGMISGHKARFDNYVAFLAKNGLRSIYEDEGAVGEFEERMKAVVPPAPIVPITSCGSHELRDRLTFMNELIGG